jgi:hypothetical protein
MRNLQYESSANASIFSDDSSAHDQLQPPVANRGSSGLRAVATNGTSEHNNALADATAADVSLKSVSSMSKQMLNSTGPFHILGSKQNRLATLAHHPVRLESALFSGSFFANGVLNRDLN